MKKKTIIIILIFVLFLFSFEDIYNFIFETFIFEIPIGYIDKEEYYDKTGFTEFMDYSKYIYPYEISYGDKYKIITKDNIGMVKDYFLDFSFTLSEELEKVYDFDESIITEGDYVRINCVKENENKLSTYYGKYEDLEIMYFDKETRTLYFIRKFY